MDWLIFWLVIAGYWAVGIKRMPVYYRRTFEKNSWHESDERELQKYAAWCSLGVASVWPYYEAGLWLRDHIIHTMTAEERRQAEFEKAERIVAEYTERKEREEREAFDRQLRGEE